jgi:hypothetical protein
LSKFDREQQAFLDHRARMKERTSADQISIECDKESGDGNLRELEAGYDKTFAEVCALELEVNKRLTVSTASIAKAVAQILAGDWASLETELRTIEQAAQQARELVEKYRQQD